MRDTSYGQATFAEKIGTYASIFFHLPIVLIWTLLTSPFHHNNRHKSWKRVVGDKVSHHATRTLNARQLQWLTGTTHSVYRTWTRANKLPNLVDELDMNARLLWIGERRKDKVILWIHGGAFIFPMQDVGASFWNHVKQELKAKDKEVGLAVLNYSLIPTATFPTQLTQAVLAIQYLLFTGLEPHNLQLTSDSAGANLILQLISHILHPVPSVPPLTLSSPFAGVYLMSPWVCLTSDAPSMTVNNSSDTIGTRAIHYWADLVLAGLPADAVPYLEAVKAPKAWWDGISQVAERVLVSVGGAECFKDDIVRFGQGLCEVHSGARLILQEHGVHDDPYLDFIWGTDGERKLGALTPLIVGWLVDGWRV